MAGAERCERCDRAECMRDDSWIAMTTGDTARSAANAEARRDCEAHAVDWRARCLAAEAYKARVEPLIANLREMHEDAGAQEVEDAVVRLLAATKETA